MNRIKISVVFLLAVILCLGLTGCAGEQALVGDDWRASGVVAAEGTITHDGEGSVPVLVTISTDSAAFYWDQPEQVLFDSVSFPMTVHDAEQAFNAISFDDINGDGQSDVLVSFIHENGEATELVWIWEPTERYVFREDLSEIPGSSAEDLLAGYVGLWEYVGENLWVNIHADQTWEIVNGREEVIESGSLWIDETGITLHFDGSGDVLTLAFTDDGALFDTVNLVTLAAVDEIRPVEPYFSANGLEINAVANAGTFLLENGVCSYTGVGDGYAVGDCYWEIIKNSDYTHDGIREIQFDAVCYIPASAVPYFDTAFVTSVDGELYDYATGMWLTASTTYGNSERGENYYLHTIDRNGDTQLIEFSYSTSWQYNVSDWAQVLTKSYMVYLPEDYDGLVFAAEAQADNYRDCAKRMQLDSIAPEASLMDIPTIDPYQNLYFSVCY